MNWCKTLWKVVCGSEIRYLYEGLARDGRADRVQNTEKPPQPERFFVVYVFRLSALGSLMADGSPP